jgi:predicted AAA+ superfamily ATPase
MIVRQLEKVINGRLGTGKAIIVLGPRQTGKTTLLHKIAMEQGDFLFLDGDDLLVKSRLESANTEILRQVIGNNKIIFFDEAQRIKNIGLILKIIIDQIHPDQILVSGSSSLELANEINEPLTGRKWEYMLYPISWQELESDRGYMVAQQQLEQRLIFGSYPEIINNPGEEEIRLKQLSTSYLYKDLLTYRGIKKPEIIEKLLRALALQLGSEVSYNELAGLIQVDKNTIQSYIDLLEKAFVLFRLHPLSRNLRNEISTSRKIYFYDNGVRNALISNFNPLAIRSDIGPLWENFLISERRKHLEYTRISCNTFFWRTSFQQEIDYIEESGGKLDAYEFKWSSGKLARFSKSFMNAYNTGTLKTVNRENFREFLK